jgi:SAM-dependent methyltransferase
MSFDNLIGLTTMRIKWWMKILIKNLLINLPIKYSTFQRLSVFKHGGMSDPDYAFGVANKHYSKAKKWLDKEFTVLEMGPGDSLMSALNMTALGAKKCYLVDVGEFATKDINTYKKGLSYLDERAIPISKVNKNANTVDEFLKNLNVQYLTKGLASLQTIPDESVDFIWSHSVLQHIRASEFDEVIKEFNRILKQGGVCSHVIDLKDTIDDSLNNLRFNDQLWESSFFVNSGYYTNRLRHNEIIQSFKKMGFKTSSEETYLWKKLPIKKTSFNKKYRHYPEKDLLIQEFDVVLTKERAIPESVT